LKGGVRELARKRLLIPLNLIRMQAREESGSKAHVLRAGLIHFFGRYAGPETRLLRLYLGEMENGRKEEVWHSGLLIGLIH
jgi:hypothetical protein